MSNEVSVDANRARPVQSGPAALSADPATGAVTRTLGGAVVGLMLALGAASLTACNEVQPPVVRVQPGAIEVSAFDGEWYTQQTVIDSPYSAGFTFVGEQGSLDRIRWEIGENFLIARRTYEFIGGAETNGIGGAATEQGAVVASYPILSHFDIRREYNPVTGEEQNVIVENATDRPWYQRRFIRVDWSRNLANQTDLFAIARFVDGMTATPVAWVDNNPNSPLAPRFEQNDSGETYYIDVVNRMLVEPSGIDIPGYGRIPSCFLYYEDHLDCAAAEISVRNSFLRIDESRDYQPNNYTGDRMERFGYFVTARTGYDDHYGVIEDVRYRYANRHNLWQQSHRRTPTGELVRCVDDAGCDTAAGSSCDLDWARAHHELDGDGHLSGACTIPYRERAVRPIVYYTSSNFPEDLRPDVDHFAAEWNSAFVDTVGSLRQLECERAGAENCDAERTREDAQQMFVVCRSPVQRGDNALCGEPGTVANPGDLRYSLIGWVSDAHLSSPLGYGPSSADPITGEIIMGNAFVYGAALETLESQARDIIALLNGAVTETGISNGQPQRDWVASMEAGRANHAFPVTPADLAGIDASMDFSWARPSASERARRTLPSTAAELETELVTARRRLVDRGALSTTPTGHARLAQLRGSDIERMMVNDDMVMAAGLDPRTTTGTAISGDTLTAASPLAGLSLDRLRAVRTIRNEMRSTHCVLDADFADEGLLGLAREIARAARSESRSIDFYGVSYPLRREDQAPNEIDWELVRNALRHPIFDAVTAHEVGHTIGLRHNFSGSYDALNYQPRYWEIRDDGNMAGRAWDPPSETERNLRITEYQYSTVMDYGVNFVVTDSNGIGHYDRAAIKMGYGDLAEVFTNVASPREAAWWHAIQVYGWPAPLTEQAFSGGEVTAYQYTDWPRVIGSPQAMQERADVPYSSLRPQRALLMQQGIDLNLVDSTGRVAVPFMFCSDEQADLGPDCQRYDQGADPYETVTSVADNYWNYYVFSHFRRRRIGFNPDWVIDRSFGRYFEKLQSANQIYALYRGIFEDIFSDSAGWDTFYTRPNAMGAYTAAVSTAFGTLTRVVTAPEPGSYTVASRGDGSLAYQSGGNAQTVDSVDGRYMETSWDNDAGYYWFDQLDRVGYFYDKALAIMVLTDPTTHFLGRDTDADVRRYQLNFATTFAPAMDTLFRGLLGENWHAIGQTFDTDGNVVPASIAALTEGDVGATPINPNAGFSVQLYAAVFGMAFIPQTYNQDFLHRSRIFVRGGAEEVDIDPTRTLVEFTDPSSGLTYVAVSYPDADSHETGVGAQLLLHAQALDVNGEDVELRRFIDNIDLMRRLTWLFGFGQQPI